MLSREQLLSLFERFDSLISQPDVKKRIADAVNDQQDKFNDIWSSVGNISLGKSCLRIAKQTRKI